MCFFSLFPANSCWKGKKLNLEIRLQERSNIVRCVSVSRISFWLMRQSIEPICIMNMYYIQQSKNIAIAFKWAISFFVISLYFFSHSQLVPLFTIQLRYIHGVYGAEKKREQHRWNVKYETCCYCLFSHEFFVLHHYYLSFSHRFVFCSSCSSFLQSIWMDREEKKRIESAYMSLCVDSHEF